MSLPGCGGYLCGPSVWLRAADTCCQVTASRGSHQTEIALHKQPNVCIWCVCVCMYVCLSELSSSSSTLHSDCCAPGWASGCCCFLSVYVWNITSTTGNTCFCRVTSPPCSFVFGPLSAVLNLVECPVCFVVDAPVYTVCNLMGLCVHTRVFAPPIGAFRCQPCVWHAHTTCTTCHQHMLPLTLAATPE